MTNRSGNGTSSFKVKARTNAATFTNMITARFRESRYLVRDNNNVNVNVNIKFI